jgi:hypothetical protein
LKATNNNNYGREAAVFLWATYNNNYGREAAVFLLATYSNNYGREARSGRLFEGKLKGLFWTIGNHN